MTNQMENLLTFLGKVKEAKLWYRLSHHIDDAISVEVAVPGQLWEIDFYLNGDVYVERFRSDGRILGETVLNELLRDYRD